jgi:hypothetical protein
MEAIRLTRAMGCRYLWIDSLCIIQDSKEDWEKEAALMAFVYGGSLCNVSFLFPEENGITPARQDPRGWVPCILRRSPSASTITEISRSDNPEWLRPQRWPLLSRGWVFQEQLLCTRNVYCGDKTLVWECSSQLCDELLGKLGNSWSVPRFDIQGIITKGEITTWAESVSGFQGKDSEIALEFAYLVFGRSILGIWARLINQYRSRNLTKYEDRKIAFAGIARGLQTISGLHYVAGLWTEWFTFCLLWAVSVDDAGE